MEEEAPPSRTPARCITTTVFATAATTGAGDDPSSSSDHALGCIVMTSSTMQPDEHELHSSSSPSLFPPLVLTTAPPCISSSSATACIATSSYDYGQPELHSFPPLSPNLCSRELGSASSSMIPSHQQHIPPVPAFDGSSLHARGISQPSFNASGNIISADLDVPWPVESFPPLSSLHGQQQPAQPASTTSAGMVLGQTDDFFVGLAQSTTSKPPLSFVSSFGVPMHGVPFPDLGQAPAVSTPLQNLVNQQQQQHPARASLLAPSVVFGQSHSFAGLRQSTWEHQQQAPQQSWTGSSSRSAGLPPRWQPPSRSHIVDSTTTFGYVQPPSSDSELPPLPPSLQTPPSLLVEPAHTSCEMPGQGGLFMGMPFQDTTGQQPLLDSAWRERFQLSRNTSFMDDGAMVSMPTLSVGASGSSSGSLLFTDVEMEKIRKEEHLSHLVKTDPKRVRRMLRNRESSKKLKERKESHRVSLEDQLRSLEMEHEALSRQTKLQEEGLAEIKSQNRMLNSKLQGLERKLKLKEELNEALRSTIQSLQQMSLSGGQCSNSGLHQHMRSDVHMSSHMDQPEQLEMHENNL